MKSKLLLTSALLVGVATLFGVSGALFVESRELAVRFASAGGIFALGSVGLFFVGLVSPSDRGSCSIKE